MNFLVLQKWQNKNQQNLLRAQFKIKGIQRIQNQYYKKFSRFAPSCVFGGNLRFNSRQIVDGVYDVVTRFGYRNDKSYMSMFMDELNAEVQRFNVNPESTSFAPPMLSMLQLQIEEIMEKYNGKYIKLENMEQAYTFIHEEVLKQIRMSKSPYIHESQYPYDCFNVQINLNLNGPVEQIVWQVIAAMSDQRGSFDVYSVRHAFSIDVEFNSGFDLFEQEEDRIRQIQKYQQQQQQQQQQQYQQSAATQQSQQSNKESNQGESSIEHPCVITIIRDPEGEQDAWLGAFEVKTPRGKVTGHTLENIEKMIPDGKYYNCQKYRSPRFDRDVILFPDINDPNKKDGTSIWEYVEIHHGNFASNTEGCILVGESRGKLWKGEKRYVAVKNSNKTLEKILEMVEDDAILIIIETKTKE